MTTLPLAELTLYSVSVALHVIFVVVGLGAAFAFPFLGAKAKESPENIPYALEVMSTVQTKLIQPASVLILLTGFYQVWDGPYSFSDGWLSIAFALFAIYMGIVGAVSLPTTKKALELANEAKASGSDYPPELFQLIAKNAKVGPILGLLIVAITFLMEAKPF